MAVTASKRPTEIRGSGATMQVINGMHRNGRDLTLLNGSIGVALVPRQHPVADLHVLDVLGGEVTGGVDAGGHMDTGDEVRVFNPCNCPVSFLWVLPLTASTSHARPTLLILRHLQRFPSRTVLQAYFFHESMRDSFGTIP